MIRRSVAMRQGRRGLAAFRPQSAIRRLWTDAGTTDTVAGEPAPKAGFRSSSEPERPISESPEIEGETLDERTKRRPTQEIISALRSEAVVEHNHVSWTRPYKIGDQVMSPSQLFAEFQRMKKNTRKLGSKVERRYVPSQLLLNPPRPEDVTLELLMASQTHLGHNTSCWNPANSRYIFGVRQGIHIISLETTAAHLRRAARVVEEVAYRGGVILFAGTRKNHMEIVTTAAKLAGACHLFTKWMPGSITNRDVLLQTRNTKVVDHLDKQLDDFHSFNTFKRPLVPDLVVCLNPLENHTLLYECGLKSIPTIGVIDTNVDPSWVTYTIPANDDSLRAMALIAGVLGRAGERGKTRRLEDASQGNVPWQTSPDLQQHMRDEIKAANRKMKEVMGRIQHQVHGFTEEEKKMLATRYTKKAESLNELEMMGALSQTAAGEETGTSKRTASVESRKAADVGKRHTERRRETGAKAETEAKAISETEAETETEAKAEPEAMAEAETETEAKAEPEAMAEAEAEAEAAVSKDEASQQAGSAPTREAEVDAETETERQEEADAKAATEAEVQAEAEAEDGATEDGAKKS